MEIKDILTKLLEKKRKNNSWLSQKSGYNKTTISKILKGDSSGNFNTVTDLLETLGYELKVVKKGIFYQDIIEWTEELPARMEKDVDCDPGLAEEFGEPIRTIDEYLILGPKMELANSRIYLFPDGKIEADRYSDFKPIMWMERPKCRM